MPQYNVTVCYYASTSVEVEADTPEAAAEAAYGESQASLCHQCNTHLELGDPYKAIVCDEGGNELYEDSDNG